MTWEDVLSLAGDRLDKASLWTALIPGMGDMALLRDLRNVKAFRMIPLIEAGRDGAWPWPWPESG